MRMVIGMDTFKQECKLCDNVIINDECFKERVDVLMDIFDILLLKLKLDNETQNVMCTMCSSKLFAAHKFKLTCLYSDNRIIPNVDLENPKPVDLKKIYLKEKGIKQESKILDDREICRLCFQSIVNDYKSIQEVPPDRIQIYIPEINFAISTNPAVCLECYDALCVNSSFIRDCLDVERKRKMYATNVEDKIFTDPCIKTEEIEIKSEETHDKTVFEDICHLKMEEKDEGETSPHSQVDSTDTEESKSLCDVGDVKETGEYFKWEEGKTTSESLVVDTELRSKRASQAQANESDCSCSKPKSRNSRKSQAKLKRKEIKVQKFHCDKCGFNTRHRESYVRHYLLHKDPSEVQTYECDGCNYKSIYKLNLRRHQLKHKDPSEVQTYECDECDYKSIHKSNLKMHQLRHKDPSEVQMYECSECDYKSIHKRSLKRHLLCHKDASEVNIQSIS